MELNESMLETLNLLHYGREVFIKDTIDDSVKTHWFENIGKDGFYTTENQGKPMRFIKARLADSFLDFEDIKDYLTCRK